MHEFSSAGGFLTEACLKWNFSSIISIVNLTFTWTFFVDPKEAVANEELLEQLIFFRLNDCVLLDVHSQNRQQISSSNTFHLLTVR